ncbi:MAG: M67 family metallopeptidase [Candidatus Bathyarchaeota archaeon]|nr:M67 family metallopeptidase [Candidatus Bathyarchaeota archaeon]
MIVFKKTDLQIIAQHSRDLFPTESCGIILGKKQDNIKIVKKIFPTKNILKSRTKYQINPREQLNIYMKADEISLEVLGYYHSHPFGDTKPSEIDIKEANQPCCSYVIYSNEQDDFKSFHWNGSSFLDEELRISN